MKKLVLLITIVAVTFMCGCSMIKKTNAPDAERKSDNAILKENTQDTLIEMEE